MTRICSQKSLTSDLSDSLQAEAPSEQRDTSYRDEGTTKATEKKENLEADFANMEFDAGASEDPHMKVKGSITELISRLLEEFEATQNACFDEETSKATEKEDLEISTLQSELSALSNRQLHTDTIVQTLRWTTRLSCEASCPTSNLTLSLTI